MVKHTLLALLTVMMGLLQPLSAVEPLEPPPQPEVSPPHCPCPVILDPCIPGQGVSDGIATAMILGVIAVGAIAGFVAWGNSSHHGGHHKHKHHHHCHCR